MSDQTDEPDYLREPPQKMAGTFKIFKSKNPPYKGTIRREVFALGEDPSETTRRVSYKGATNEIRS